MKGRELWHWALILLEAVKAPALIGALFIHFDGNAWIRLALVGTVVSAGGYFIGARLEDIERIRDEP